MKKAVLILSALLIPICFGISYQLIPDFDFKANELNPPPTISNMQGEPGGVEKPCPNDHPDWRARLQIDGVDILESPACQPDNPYDVAASVKGMNNISMPTLMNTHFAEDTLIKSDDIDGDGDPDIIHIKLEIIELNGISPDSDKLIYTYDIAPGLQPGMWVYAPKSRGMALKNFYTRQANPLLRAPSPVIRVEQGDKVYVTLENTHYLPHTIHLHGVDHPWMTEAGLDNDGVESHPVFPGKSHTYEISPRHAGTMFYHCHVQTAQHLMMGLKGMFIVEENRPNNWVQTFNVGAGHVRHPSVAVQNKYDQEYDLYFHSIDKRLSQIIQNAHDPRLVAERMNREYNMTESFENYFLLNGHSFPYTLRDGMIIAEQNQRIKLRVANGQRSMLALHIHGHKPTATAYDGVEAEKGLYLTRDVFDLAPAQRLDLELNTVNDGLHSYGAGLWMMHDHIETGTTSDGMEPGGNMAILAYQKLLDEQGMPKNHTELFNLVFNKNYYAKKFAVWGEGEFSHSLGKLGKLMPDYPRIVIFGLTAGLGLGLLLMLLRYFKHKKHPTL